jgi:signal peptidase I
MTSQKQDSTTSQPTQSSQPQSTPSEPQAPQSGSGWLRWWQSQRETIQILAIAIVLAVVIRLFVAEPRFIPSDSMVPTLEIGDRLVVEKVSYYFRPPHTGDIIVFDPPEKLQEFGYTTDQAFIKRIIAEPGQTVAVQNGRVYVNNQPLQEPYIAEPPAYELRPVTVPDGQYFVMGDNRNNSNDSHVWGFLPRQNIIGRAVFRFWTPDRIGSIQAIAPAIK